MALLGNSLGSASFSRNDNKKPHLLSLPSETLEAIFGYVRPDRLIFLPA
jgi:hypothetical protein